MDGLKQLEDGLGNILALTPFGGRGGITGNQPINPLNNQLVSLDEYHSALTFVFTLVAPAPKTLRAPQAAPVLTEAAGSATVAHRNSLSYVGETHVYVIRGPDGTPIKIGESAQGIRSSDGASRRAEQQVRSWNREVGPGHESEIRKTFDNKADARRYETALIERFRRWFGQDALPGNKTNR